MRRRNERGDAGLGLVIAILSFFGVAFVTAVGIVMTQDLGGGGGGVSRAAPPPATVTSPAPPDNECARKAAADAGVLWTSNGWEILGTTKPNPSSYDNADQDRQYQSDLAVWRGTVAVKAGEAQSLWASRECDRVQAPLPTNELPPNPTTSTTLLVSFDGTYDLTMRDTSPDCVSESLPTQLIVSGSSGGNPSLTFVSAGGSGSIPTVLRPDKTFEGTIRQGALTAHIGGRFQEGGSGGALIRSGEVRLSDPAGLTNECSSTFEGVKRP